MDITDTQVRDYFNSFYTPIDDRLISFRQVGERGMVPIILKETESVLKMLLDMKKPEKILEIGTAIGYSSTFFALYCPEARIYTIEKDEYAHKAAVSNISKSALDDRVTLLMGDGQEQTEKLRDEGVDGFDFVFIDAAKSHYRRFLESAVTVCKPGAVLVSDNILMHGMTVTEDCDPRDKHKSNIRKMREYVEFISRDKRFHTTLFSVGDGLAVSIYMGKNE